MNNKFIILGLFLIGIFFFSFTSVNAVSSCTPSSCPGDYVDQGTNSYWNGNYWTTRRTCHRDAQCDADGYGGYSIVAQSDLGVGVDDEGETYFTPVFNGLSTKCYKLYGKATLIVSNWDPGGILKLDTESVRLYAATSGYSADMCVDQPTNPEETSPIVERGRGGGLSATGQSLFYPYKDTSCGGGAAWGILGMMYTKLYASSANWLTDDYNYYYCDVPYVSTITLASPIYDGAVASCYAAVRGSYSNPDEIKVQWYVNDVNVVNDNCVGAACDDDSGSTWSHTFTLAHTNFVKGDDVYCEARGYSEDGGYGNYDQSSETTVSNAVPTWTSISLNETYASQGDAIKITATGEADVDSDTLAMYCCNTDVCSPSTANYDFCYVTGDTSPYDLFCTGLGLSGDEVKTVRCVMHDGIGYSAIKSDTYVADNSAPSITIDNPKAQGYSYNESLYLNYTVTDDGMGVDSCWYNIINSTNDIIIANTTLAACANSTFDAPRSDTYNLTLYSNDTLGNEDYAVVIFSISLVAPAISMNQPVDEAFINSGTNVYFNFTASDDGGVDICKLYSNFTGVWKLNQTFTGIISGTQNGTIKNLVEDYYKWTMWCNDTIGNSAWALNNQSLTVDLSNPSSTITQPGNATNMSDNTPDINITLEDNVGSSIAYTFYLNNVPNKTGVVLNATPINITLETLPDALYEIIVEATDNASNALNSSVLYLTIDTISPYVNVTSPTNMSYNATTIWFNATSNASIGNVIKLNYNGSNVTIDINTSLIVEEGIHQLLLYANDSAGNFGLNDSVYFSVDLTPPEIIIAHPTGADVTSGSMVVQITTNERSSVCNYSMSGAVNTSISSSDNLTFLNVITTPSDGNHNIVFYCSDMAGNINTTNISFLVRKWVGGGGGGGGGPPTTIVSANVTWSMTTEQDTLLYDFQLVPGTTRSKNLLFESLSNEIRSIILSCEGELCSYIVFETLSFDLPVKRDIKTAVEFTLDIPSDIVKGKYDANIIAIDDLGEFSIVTVKGDVGTGNFIFIIFSKLFTSKEIFGIKIPYLVIFLFTTSFIGFGLFYLILKPTKISAGGGIAGIAGIVSSFIILVFI